MNIPGNRWQEQEILKSHNMLNMYEAVNHQIPTTHLRYRGQSADEWLRKLWYIYTMGYHSAIKKIHLNQF